MNTCKTCYYWDSKIEGSDTPFQVPASVDPNDKRKIDAGKCRRYAPRENFAWTREDDWCGEYLDKDEPQRKKEIVSFWKQQGIWVDENKL